MSGTLVLEERRDGSAIVELPADDKKDEIEVVDEDLSEPVDAPKEDPSEDDKDEDGPDHETEDDKHARNVRQRHERKEKRASAKQRDLNLIKHLQKENSVFAERLAKLENTQNGLRLNRLDEDLQKQEDEIARIRHHLSTTEDRVAHAELEERLVDEKMKLRDLRLSKEAEVKAAKAGKAQNVPSPKKSQIDRLARAWMGKNTWFDRDGQGTDTKIATVIDNEMTDEGWDASDPEYWEELDSRLTERLPHRYQKRTRSAPPVTASRNENSSQGSIDGQKQFIISAERKKALIDAGKWDSPERGKYIKRFMDYDKANRTN